MEAKNSGSLCNETVTLFDDPGRSSSHLDAVFLLSRVPGMIWGRACPAYVLLPVVVCTCGSLRDAHTIGSTPHLQSLEEGVEEPS